MAMVIAATLQAYEYAGWRAETKIDVSMDEKRSTFPVCTSVMFIEYCLIIPFWFSRLGGFHDRDRENELSASPIISSGGPLGAVNRREY